MLTKSTRFSLKLILCLTAIVSLQGCLTAAVVGTGAAVATKIATDPRTAGTQLDDETLEARVVAAMNKDPEIKQDSNVNAVSYNSKVLLIGQVPNENLKETAKNLASGVDHVTDVYNEIRIGKNISLAQNTIDTWTTTQVKSKLFLDSNVKSADIKVVTENGEVFLMGDITQNQANTAVNIASHIKGVKKVIKVFSYIN